MSNHRVLTALTALTALSAMPLPAQTPDPALAHARALLKSSPLIDGHNDLPWEIRTNRAHPRDVAAYDLRTRTPGHTDLARLAEGGVGGQFWSVYIPGDLRGGRFATAQLEQIDIARRMIAMYPEKLAPAYSADDIMRDFKAGKVASLMGMEGGHAIENSLGALRAFYALGARYMTLTHNVTLDWADAALDSAKHGGLTPFGREVVREMNRLGMLVDLAHVSPGTMSDALDATRAPVIFSHSGARALVDHPRNVPDSILARLKQNGGVVMVPVVPSFVSTAVKDWEEQSSEAFRAMRAERDTAKRREMRREFLAAHPEPHATVRDVADMIEHVRDVAGVDHVGIGGDYDGITSTPDGLPDVSSYPVLFAELIHRGWNDEDLKKLAGLNVLRVLRQAETVAKQLQQTEQPSTKTIDEMDK